MGIEEDKEEDEEDKDDDDSIDDASLTYCDWKCNSSNYAS